MFAKLEYIPQKYEKIRVSLQCLRKKVYICRENDENKQDKPLCSVQKTKR